MRPVGPLLRRVEPARREILAHRRLQRPQRAVRIVDLGGQHARALRRQRERAAEGEPRGVRGRRAQHLGDPLDVRLRTMPEERERQMQRLVGHRAPHRRVGGRRPERGQRGARGRRQVKRDEEPEPHAAGGAAGA